MNSIQYQNHYFCGNCSKFWEQVSEAMETSKCPTCQSTQEPYRSLPYLQGFHTLASRAEYARFIVSWVELRLIHDIKHSLDKHGEIEFDGSMTMQLFDEQFSRVAKHDGKYWVISSRAMIPFHEYNLEDNTAVCVYDLIWILSEIERREV
jgi:hypothetical protein